MRRALVYLATVLLLAPACSADCAKPLLVTFGDSLTDTGNFFNNDTLGQGKAPLPSVYYDGRFTNAPGTWVDQLPGQVQVANFAFGDAFACNPPATSAAPENIIPDLAQQIDLYFQKSQSDSECWQRKYGNKQVIPVIWIGHNDLHAVLANPTVLANLTNLQAAIAKPIGCIFGGLERLLAAGHKTLILASLAPVDMDPLVGVANAPSVRRIVQIINMQLESSLKQLQGKYLDRKLVFWDVNPVMTDVIVNPKKYGFSFTDPLSCVVGGSALHGLPPQSVCSNPQAYVFFDSQHPTSKGHRVVTQSMMNTLKSHGFLCNSARKGRG